MINLNEKIFALIMIGGKSTRVGGGIKSFIEFNNKNIFDRILEKTKPQIKNILINCNTEEMKLKKYNLPIIKDIKQGYLGPLAGIHSAMSWLQNNQPQVQWIITLPGDTPFIPRDLITQFKKKISPNLKIILAKSNNKIHPIIGAWHISLLKSLDKNIDEGTRKIMSWAKLHPIDYVSFDATDYDPFFNINTKEDIYIAEEIEKKNCKKT